jgi:serine phosphatase RsbU (regulator of sigma subunit)
MDVDQTLELQQQVARLQALLEASRRIHATIQLDEVLRETLEIVVRELEMEGAFFTTFPFSEGRIPPRFLLSPNHSEFARGSVRFPLVDKGGLVITDLVVIPREGMQLTLEESDFIESLAVQTSVAIENARHHERTVHLQRVEQDLASARAIQRSLLPQTLKEVPGYKTVLRSVSCYEVAGDYVDVVSQPTGEQVMIVADVAGKGLASALVGSSFRAAFRAMALAALPLVQIATQLNVLHYSEGSEARRRYVTVLLLKLDPVAHRLEVVNAGHNPGILWPDHRKSHILLEASGTPVGLLPFSNYSSESHELKDGARLLAYTDGMTEVFRGEEEFGTERLIETFSASASREGEAILDHIWNTLEAFTTEPEQRDDMTALVLLRQP